MRKDLLVRIKQVYQWRFSAKTLTLHLFTVYKLQCEKIVLLKTPSLSGFDDRKKLFIRWGVLWKCGVTFSDGLGQIKILDSLVAKLTSKSTIGFI